VDYRNPEFDGFSSKKTGHHCMLKLALKQKIANISDKALL
jgi:hypothetical protein